jgi:hypothetical protein
MPVVDDDGAINAEKADAVRVQALVQALVQATAQVRHPTLARR